jgi:hypothetical protein
MRCISIISCCCWCCCCSVLPSRKTYCLRTDFVNVISFTFVVISGHMVLNF